MTLPGPLAALRHPSFSRYMVAFVVTQAGFWMSTVTFQWLVANRTDSDPRALGLLAFFNYVPLLILSLPSGLIADRLDRKRIILTSWLFTAVVAATLALMDGRGLLNLPAIYSGAFLVGTALALNAPASQAIIANSVSPADLSSAISLQSAALNLMRIAGPILAAPILLVWGAGASYATYAVASALAAAVMLRIPFARAQVPGDAISLLSRFWLGVSHVRERYPAALALLSVAFVSTFGFSYVALLPVFALKAFHAGSVGLSIMFAAVGSGAVVGALSSTIGSSTLQIRGAAVRIVILGIALIAFALVGMFQIAVAVLVVVGGAGFASMTSLNTIVQRVIDDSKRGRVMSIFTLCWGGLLPIGSLLMGTLASTLLPLTVVTVGFGTLCAAYGIALVALTSPNSKVARA